MANNLQALQRLFKSLCRSRESAGRGEVSTRVPPASRQATGRAGATSGRETPAARCPDGLARSSAPWTSAAQRAARTRSRCGRGGVRRVAGPGGDRQNRSM